MSLKQDMNIVRKTIADMMKTFPSGNLAEALSEEEKDVLDGVVQDCWQILRLVGLVDKPIQLQGVAPTPYGGPVITASMGSFKLGGPIQEVDAERHMEPTTTMHRVHRPSVQETQEHIQGIDWQWLF